METELGIVGDNALMELGFVPELLFVPRAFTPQTLLELLGLKTYIAAVNPDVFPAPTVTDGLAPHVPLNVHQNTAMLWLTPGEYVVAVFQVCPPAWSIEGMTAPLYSA